MCLFKLGMGILQIFFSVPPKFLCAFCKKKINRTNIMAPQVGQWLAFAYPDHGLSLQGHMLIYNRSVFQFFFNWFFQTHIAILYGQLESKLFKEKPFRKRSHWPQIMRNTTVPKHLRINFILQQSQADSCHAPPQLHLGLALNSLKLWF